MIYNQLMPNSYFGSQMPVSEPPDLNIYDTNISLEIEGRTRMKPAAEKKAIQVKTVERSLWLLEILARENTPLPLTKFAQLAKMSISTTYRILQTLCRNDFIERDETTGHYRLGLKAFIIGTAAIQRTELRSVALRHLTKLASDCGETACLAILAGYSVIYSDCIKAPSFLQIGIQTGIPVPACKTSSGKVLLAGLSMVEQQKIIELLMQNKLVDDPKQLQTELARIADDGYAAGMNDIGGKIAEISIPVYNHLGACVGAISVFKPVQGELNAITEQTLLGQLAATGLTISRNLGYQGKSAV